MKFRKFVFGFVLQTALAALVANFAFAVPQTFTGVVTDDMCGKKHTMMPGKPDSECIRACVKSGSKYALLVGDKIYVLKGDAKQIDHFAGKKAKVTGDVSGTTITLASIAESTK
jgi:hypothetical protein